MYTQPKKKNNGFFAFIIVVLFFYLEIYGLFHAFKGHGSTKGILSIFIPPMAWYYAVESHFHKNILSGDLEKDTARVFVVLTNFANQEPNKRDENEILAIKEDLKEYKKIALLKQNVLSCIRYYNLVISDIILNGKEKNINSIDDLLKPSEERLKAYEIFKVMPLIQKLFKDMEGEISSVFRVFILPKDQEKLKKILQNSNPLEKMMNELMSGYTKIFIN